METSNLRWSAIWLLVAFAFATLAYRLYYADALDVVLLNFLFLPWIIGPAGVAALVSAKARMKSIAWTFLLAEVGVVASTAWLWIDLHLHPDAQNGIAVIFFPIIQFAALAVYSLLALPLVLARRNGN